MVKDTEFPLETLAKGLSTLMHLNVHVYDCSADYYWDFIEKINEKNKKFSSVEYWGSLCILFVS